MSGFQKEDKNLLKRNLELFHTSTNDTSKVNALMNICNEMLHEDWEKYLRIELIIIEEALRAEPTPQEIKVLTKALSSAYNDFGVMHGSKGSYALALAYYDKSKKIDEVIGDKSGLASCYNNIAMTYYEQGNIALALKNHNKSLKIKKEIGDKEGVADSYNNIALIKHKQGKDILALEYWMKSLGIYTEIGNKSQIANTNSNIGYYHARHKNLDLALTYYEKSLNYYLEFGSKAEIARLYNNIAINYKNQGKLELALDYFEKSLQIKREIGNKLGISTTYYNFGVIYKEQDNKKLALEYFKKSLVISDSIGDQEGKAYAYNSIAEIVHKMGRVADKKEALEFAKKSLSISKQIGFPNNIKNASGLLSEIYAEQGDFKKALEMHKLHIEMRDSLTNEKNIKVVAYEKAKFEFEKLKELNSAEYEKQKELNSADYEKKIELKKKEQEKQKLITYISTSLFILIILFVTIYFQLRKKKNIASRQLLEIKEAQLITEIKLKEKEQIILKIRVKEETKNVQALSLELIMKKDFSTALINQLKRIENVSKSDLLRVELFIQNELELKSTQVELEEQMGGLSSDFYNSLNIKHPNLTELDKKLAAMIVMNMSNKGIAISKNITPESVKISKNRLKHKLSLSASSDLKSYLMEMLGTS